MKKDITQKIDEITMKTDEEIRNWKTEAQKFPLGVDTKRISMEAGYELIARNVGIAYGMDENTILNKLSETLKKIQSPSDLAQFEEFVVFGVSKNRKFFNSEADVVPLLDEINKVKKYGAY